MNMTPDAADYLAQAAIQIAKEDNFHPVSEAHLQEWMKENAQRVGERAKSLMQELMAKLFGNPKLMDQVKQVIGEFVYDSIPKSKEKQYSARYLKYCAHHGNSPEEQMKIDGNMINFICWRE